MACGKCSSQRLVDNHFFLGLAQAVLRLAQGDLLLDVAAAFALADGAGMRQIGAGAIDILLAFLDLALPVLELVVQKLKDAANLDLGRAEGFLRLRSIAGQRGVQRLERVERVDSG